MAWCVWITGLPGSGKSTIADSLLRVLPAETRLLRLDEIRKRIVPEPEYTSEERERVYRTLGDMAVDVVEIGMPVLVDATAHEARWRARVRDAVPDYLEVRVDCPLDECVRREAARPEGKVMADIYRKALERRDSGIEHEDLGEVIGIDVQYEEWDGAFHVDSVQRSPGENALRILTEMRVRRFL